MPMLPLESEAMIKTPPDNHMQRSRRDKVLGRGRGHAAPGQVTSARVLKGKRAS
jgi:hypothetical protein